MYPLRDEQSQQKNEQVSEVSKTKTVSKRASYTRGVAQRGGLLNKSGVPEALGINSEVDLQKIENLEKAAILLGCLAETCDNIGNDVLEKHSLWKSRGLSMLRDKKVNENKFTNQNILQL